MTFNSMYFFYFSMLGFLLVGWAVLALVAARRLSLVAVLGPLIAVVSLVVGHGLQNAG